VAEIQDICTTCDGSGRVRNNHMEGGKYVFQQTTCHNCNGSGLEKYQKCAECSAVVPMQYFDEHECGD